LILLENPRQLGNVGAVIRVAAGFGARAVRTTGSVDPWHPAVVRGAAGLHFAIPVGRIDDDQVDDAAEGPLVLFDPSGVDLRSVPLPDRSCLAFGSERQGASAVLRRGADLVVAIPIRDRVSSYNLATSVAIALYHWASGPGRSAGHAV
jgi:TrmH family RNA methyltransferase